MNIRVYVLGSPIDHRVDGALNGLQTLCGIKPEPPSFTLRPVEMRTVSASCRRRRSHDDCASDTFRLCLTASRPPGIAADNVPRFRKETPEANHCGSPPLAHYQSLRPLRATSM
jgi:hypothetical protein